MGRVIVLAEYRSQHAHTEARVIIDPLQAWRAWMALWGFSVRKPEAMVIEIKAKPAA